MTWATKSPRKKQKSERRQRTSKRLVNGSRPEEIAEQKHRVEAMETLRDLAQAQLADWKRKLQNDLVRLDELLLERDAESLRAKQEQTRVRSLRDRGASTQKDLEEAEVSLAIATAQWKQATAERQAREAEGTLEAEAALAYRAKELADAKSQLSLLEAGSRPEDIAASRARLERLEEELVELRQYRDRLVIISPISGAITTARLHERLGRKFAAGETICEVENVDQLEMVIEVHEQNVRRLERGQVVTLKLRSLPFDQFPGEVQGIAPRVVENEHASRTVIVTCRLDGSNPILRPGMSGYARISSGTRRVGEILVEKILGYIRTEYWW